ncbi:MAG: aldehyde dehydrogenase family protein [Planctomycetota bacterium]
MSTFPDVDPATGETLAEIEITDSAALAAAIQRAHAAQPAWAELPFEERRALLAAGAERLKERAGEAADLITREMGKVRADALREVRGWAGGLDKLMDEVERSLAPEVLEAAGSETRVVREPLGVVAAITPWNFPVGMPLEIFLPALATGNAVVFKPSEHVPLTGALLHEVFSEGLPEGVFELVQGAGEVGAALVEGDVDMIGFVGSRDTGMRIMQSASRGLKRLVLELGGKDPLVVFGDADLEAAADCAVQHSLRNTGQVCCSVERVYVADDVAEEFERLVVAKASDWRHGNGMEAESRMGPMVSAEQRAKVVEQVDDAVRGGARLLLGGEQPDGAGYFYPATVLADVGEELRISRDETFGPVVSLTRFSGDEEEAVRLANDTPYGLGANVYTGDLERGQRVARRIRSGQVGINRYLGGASGAPWVGARQSGFGFLGGVDGHKQFTLPKSISYPR